MDIRSYNNMRRKQALTRQKTHWDRMIQNTEQRLEWIKSRQATVEGQLRSLEHER